ncbi:alpha/beta hydrolase [Novosphingobium lentum]|uniref:alpha/beta hydrolase n=1 Tax=Novosphingobium lentum TaxID=145287 RepID=UPI00082D4163|nr:alpha/beta hydrolase fold domain-containing protein [Novosphingobium lentum]
MLRKVLAAGAALAVMTSPVSAQAPQYVPPPSEPIAAPADPDAIPLYGANTMGSAASENWVLFMGSDHAVRNVTRPTLTPVLPDPAKATGAAVIVAPGGAFMMLAMDHEGWNVAHALADRGIAAFVLKYRLLPTPRGEAESQKFMLDRMMQGLKDPAAAPTLQNADATADALAAIALVRSGAARWHIDPARVGMIGFSAGAMTTLNAVLTAKPGEGPDFAGYIYGPQAHVTVPASAPPLFDAIALDDPLFPAIGFPIVADWHAAKKPVELHAYQAGSHGFGLGVPGTTTTLLTEEFVAWLAMNKVIPAPAPATK